MVNGDRRYLTIRCRCRLFIFTTKKLGGRTYRNVADGDMFFETTRRQILRQLDDTFILSEALEGFMDTEILAKTLKGYKENHIPIITIR